MQRVLPSLMKAPSLFHEMVDIPRAAPTRPMMMEKGGKDPPRNAFEQRAETPPAERQGRS